MKREIKFRAWDGEMMLPYNSAGMEALVYMYMMENAGEIPSDINLMQFTGLKDKNGKEIYEGDIVWSELSKHIEQGENYPFEVFWWGHSWGIKSAEMTTGMSGDFEVIGNIWENPELLK